MISKNISLYIHVPFCHRKCDYCHFYVLPDKLSLKSQLSEAVALEWDIWSPVISSYQLSSIYFGGGTPSLWGAEYVAKFLERVKRRWPLPRSIEITLEANPEQISYCLIKEYQQVGINRLSIGVQSLDNDLLKVLSRTHSKERAIESIFECRSAGIQNLSIDLMYDIPTQTLDQWSETLKQAAPLPITHLSLYNLTIEPNTLFYKKRQELEPKIPPSEISKKMYEIACESLEEVELHQYEISAFAKNGYSSIHNTGYWLGREFIGLGPSAFSYWEGKRFRNIANLQKYYHLLKESKSPIDFEEELEPSAKRRELFVLSLRMIQGCRLSSFEKRYGPFESETKTTIQNLVEQGFLQKQNSHVALTKKGILFYDTVASELI